MTVLDIIRDYIDAHGLTADETVAIVREYLEENDYDGLRSTADCEPCGCDLDDLCACGSECSDCVAGHKVRCADCRLRTPPADPDDEQCEYGPADDGYCIVAGPKETA